MDRIALVEWLDKSRNKCPRRHGIYIYIELELSLGYFEINNVFRCNSKSFFFVFLFVFLNKNLSFFFPLAFKIKV